MADINSNAKIFIRHGTPYCIGLWWQTVPGGGSLPKKSMLKKAKAKADSLSEFRFSHVALRQYQYGLGCFAKKLNPKTISLATSLRMKREQDTLLAIFHLEEKTWWVCQIKAGIVGADGDAWYSSKEEAENAVESMKQLLQDDEKTENFDTPEESWRFLEPFLRPDTPIIPLNGQTKGMKTVQKIAISIGCTIILGFIGFQFYTNYAERLTLEKMRQQAQMIEAQRRAKLANPDQFFTKHWENAPLASLAGEQCVKAMLKVPLAQNGWKLNSVACNPQNNVEAVWSHARNADYINLPEETKLNGPQQLSANYSLPALPKRGTEDTLLTREKLEPLLYQIGWNLYGHLTLQWDNPEMYQFDEKTKLFSKWQACNFTLSQLPASVFLTDDFFNTFDAIPGAIITSVEHGQAALTIKGSIYGISK